MSAAGTRTSVYINFRDPADAIDAAALPNDGGGPCPIEKIIRDSIGIHPMALLHPGRVSDASARRRLQELTDGYADGGAYFVERLARGLRTFAQAFHPQPMIVRLSDLQSDDYAKLIGGADFERPESNPMIGFRGAARYIHPDHTDAFALECAAVKMVREDMGFDNLHPMVPYCRRADEAGAVLDAMATQGLRRGERGLEIHLMAEVPNNAMEIDTLATLFDGISIGSRDLAQTVLGIDAGAAFVTAEDFNPCAPGVLKLIGIIIDGAKRHGCAISICGPAPSDHVDMLKYVIEAGIDAISLRPDKAVATIALIREIEAASGR